MTVELSRFAIKVLQGDMMTPISVYQSLTGKHKMLFESSAKHEESGRYSFIAVNPIAKLHRYINGSSIPKGLKMDTSTENDLQN
ncbi:Anthranilate synthase component 1 OS=Lysinibacillus sphaericus OX=1421 GN=trpE PE=3 SV=1 [Lysinibacillus sphaericus]